MTCFLPVLALSRVLYQVCKIVSLWCILLSSLSHPEVFYVSKVLVIDYAVFLKIKNKKVEVLKNNSKKMIKLNTVKFKTPYVS